MSKIETIDVANYVLDVGRDLSISARAKRPGPPHRIDGMTVGFVKVSGEPPHRGEVHPDGDEILYVISGKLGVVGDNDPSVTIELGPGEACIVRKGEWHQVLAIEPSQLLHITPGPRGDYRPR